MRIYGNMATSKQANKHTHKHAHCSLTSVGLAQARPNNVRIEAAILTCNNVAIEAAILTCNNVTIEAAILTCNDVAIEAALYAILTWQNILTDSLSSSFRFMMA